jgi:large subunit ribosomal protein L21
MKYAVVESGGKQYVARVGESIEVDLLPVEAGSPIEFDRVLLVVDGEDVQVGAPIIEGMQVRGTASEHIKGPKIVVFRYIPKERYRRKTGHRQQYTRVDITALGAAGSKGSADETARPLEAAPAKAKPARVRVSQPKSQAELKPAVAKPRASRGKPATKTTKTATAKKPSKK